MYYFICIGDNQGSAAVAAESATISHKKDYFSIFTSKSVRVILIMCNIFHQSNEFVCFIDVLWEHPEDIFVGVFLGANSNVLYIFWEAPHHINTNKYKQFKLWQNILFLRSWVTIECQHRSRLTEAVMIVSYYNIKQLKKPLKLR